MPGSKKSDDKASSKKSKAEEKASAKKAKAEAKRAKEEAKKAKKENKKKDATDKHPLFQSEVTAMNRGKVTRGTTFSRKEVEKHSRPKAKKPEKPQKPIPARAFKQKIQFKEKLIAGDRNKKLLRYDCIKLMEQLPSDSRMVFIHYEMPKNGYFFVLGFKEATHANEFMNAVKGANPKCEVRKAIDELSERRRDSSSESVASRETSQKTYEESEPPVRHRSASPSHRESRKQKAAQSFIQTRRDDGKSSRSSSSSSSSSSTSRRARQMSNNYVDVGHAGRSSSKPAYQRSATSTPDLSLRGGDGLVTKYVYIGPTDEENSASEYHRRDKHKKHHKHRSHQRYSFGDDVSVSMTQTTGDYSDEEFFPNGGYESTFSKPSRAQMSRKSSHRSSRRSKSRQLPLSEAETKRGGWHSDIMFVTPTPDGGVKVSADGPVMLYTATRANVNGYDSSSSEDSTSDGEEDFTYSSGTTLTLDEDGRHTGLVGIDGGYGGRR